MLSHLFFHKPEPKPQMGSWVFLVLIVLFGGLTQVQPVIGLTGLGTTLVVMSLLIELNRHVIWRGYEKAYKKHRRKNIWLEPNPVVYRLNVGVLIPTLGILGAFCLWVAYTLS